MTQSKEIVLNIFGFSDEFDFSKKKKKKKPKKKCKNKRRFS